MVLCNAQVNKEPVYDEVREESGQVISCNQVTMGPDPAYQDPSSIPRLITTSL